MCTIEFPLNMIIRHDQEDLIRASDCDLTTGSVCLIQNLNTNEVKYLPYLKALKEKHDRY